MRAVTPVVKLQTSPPPLRGTPRDYLRTPLISLNSALSRVPRLVRTVTSTSAIKDAIKAYSIAVAPELSDRNALKRTRIV